MSEGDEDVEDNGSVGDTSVLRCHGRIVAGDDGSILRKAVFSQRHTRMLVIDLARVERIDAGGLGILLGLRESARSNAIMFKLMNATKRVEAILEVTHLQRVFEFCSGRLKGSDAEPDRCDGDDDATFPPLAIRSGRSGGVRKAPAVLREPASRSIRIRILSRSSEQDSVCSFLVYLRPAPRVVERQPMLHIAGT
jgi:anti-anti-sigma factor